ncbi:hypothetical protein BV20DRAFT_1050904 [Pilatotrama ljubarskyi]|nr:hypothetical protein BV20DRAFT_1050904 [Pilatotrama ljubarskyi]
MSPNTQALIAPPLTGRLAASAWWGVVRLLARVLYIGAYIKVEDSIGGGSETMAWRGRIGDTSIVLNTEQLVHQPQDERRVRQEWILMSTRLPRDIKAATSLPIPSYDGLFVGKDVDIILMSDDGRPLYEIDDLDGRLQGAHEQAVRALQAVGIQPEDVAPRNAVFDGTVVRIVDWVMPVD